MLYLSAPTRKRLSDALAAAVEPLEVRWFLSVAQDANGWTVVTEPTNAKVVYVSSTTGNDNNPGTINAPVATLARAQALSASGPNEMLLQSGDTFTESTSDNLQSWNLSGENAADPFVLGSYGTGSRPMIYAGDAGAAFEIQSGITVNYLDILGVQFDANLRDPTLGAVDTSESAGEDRGIEIHGTGGNILIEDCSVTYFGDNGGDNLDIEGVNAPLSNVTLRRDVVDDAWTLNPGGSSSNEKCEGLYAYDVANLSVDQCTFDHNGWVVDAPGSVDTGYSHDMYFGPTCTGISVQQCVIAEASFAGIMDRSGGNIDYNLFVDNAVACSFGDADGGIMSTPGGVSGSLIGNVVDVDKAEGSIGSSPLAYGQGFVIANTAPAADVEVEDNIFTGDSQNAKPAITLTMATDTSNPSACVGINNLTISHNIIDGWRWGIQTDGRFVPGGTGLYALNGLTISDNAYINCTVAEVRHDGTFAAASESWSGDLFYDTILPEADWVTLESGDLPFSSWTADYDIGATALAVLPYADPYVSVASYDTTQSGPGTWEDYVAQADQLSIQNFNPVYMAQAAISYVDAGFNIVSTGPTITGGGSSSGGGSGNGGGTGSQPGAVTGTATASAVNASSIGTTSYTFTVNYVDQFLLNDSALDSSNLLVTGPNGFNELAAFDSAAAPYIDSNYYQHTVATYSITPPNGAWAQGEDGTYTITLLPNQPLDSSGATAQSGVIGTFTADLTDPQAQAVVPNISSSSAGAASTNFTINYSDPDGIDLSTLNNYEVQVTGPNNYSQYAALTSSSASAGSTSVACTYTMPAPNGSWSSAANGTYTVSLLSDTVADLYGNSVPGGTLATFNANVGSSDPPPNGSISGTVFNDANDDGVMDDRELPLTGVTVFIDQAGTGVYATGDPYAVTDSNGDYTITGLMPGRYAVVDAVPAGYAPTYPSTGSSVVTLTASSPTATGINFGDALSVVNTNGNGNGSTGTVVPTRPTGGGTTTLGGSSTSGSGLRATSGANLGLVATTGPIPTSGAIANLGSAATPGSIATSGLVGTSGSAATSASTAPSGSIASSGAVTRSGSISSSASIVTSALVRTSTLATPGATTGSLNTLAAGSAVRAGCEHRLLS